MVSRIVEQAHVVSRQMPVIHDLPLTAWLLVLVALIGFFLRTHHLGEQDLRGDEAFSFLYTQMPLTEVLPALAPVRDTHSPAHYLLLNLWVKGTGESEFAMRYLAVLFSLLLIPLIYLLSLQVCKSQVPGTTALIASSPLASRYLGLWVASITAVSQSLIWLGQDARNQYAMVMFFTTLGTLTLVKFVAQPGWKRWLVYAVLCVATIHSHYYGIFALLAHALYLLFAHRKFLLAYAAAVAIAALTLIPWLLVTFSLWVSQLAEPGNPELASFLTAIGQELTVGPAFDSRWGRWIFLLAAVFCLVGWQKLRQTQPGWAILLGGWLGGAVLGIFLINLRRYVFNAYYISPVAPAWWLLVGIGLWTWWTERGRWKRPFALLGVMVFFAAAGRSLYQYYRDPVTYGRTQGYRLLAEHVMEQAQPGDIFVANFPDPSLSYYLRDLPVPQTMQPTAFEQEAQITEQALADLTRQYDRLWLVPHPYPFWDTDGVVHHWLDYHLLQEQAFQFIDLEVYAYRPLPTVHQVMMPLEATASNGLHLAGAYATVNGVPTNLTASSISLSPGAELTITLLWETTSTIPQDYTIFVHLLGEDGRLIAQHDGIPVFATRPTSTWQPGEQLLDRHEVKLPGDISQARGQLVVGMYQTDTLERQTFNTEQDTVWLADVEFQR